MDEAACQGGTALSVSDNYEDRDAVERMCLYPCPVLDECREWRKMVRPTHGVWGGLEAKGRSREAWSRQSTV
ncbi:MAG: WhiB family transcriptional regulator [Phycicoccus sp.]|nr:WhiB family transcriptional regulator [Phycicoccus sp.]